jgi:hypothetical protein
VKALFFLMVVFAGIFYLLRYLRQREIDAFLDTDMVDFQSFSLEQRKERESNPLMTRAEAYAALNPNVISLKTDTNDSEAIPAYVPDPTLYRLKEKTFDEVTRNMLVQLSKVLPSDVTVLINVPLSEFVRSEKEESTRYKLANNRVAFLLCEVSDLSVVCGLQLYEADSSGQSADFVKSVFVDIGRPLLQFPLSADVSDFEIRDRLDPILLSRDKQECPKCGETMNIRKAVRGKNAGNVFWVCSHFPNCRGVVRA